MKFVKQGIFTLALLVSTQSSHATFYYYFGADTPSDGVANTAISVSTAQTAWEAQVNSLFPTLSISTFTTNAANVSAATGVSIPASPENVNLSPSTNTSLTLTGGTTLNQFSDDGKASFSALGGIGTPSFEITQTQVGDTVGDDEGVSRHSGIYYADDTTKGPAVAAEWEEVLSIGKFNGFSPGNSTHFDDDDFTLEITGGDTLYAFAFKIINNNKYDDGVTESLDIFTANGGTQLAHIGDDSNDGTAGIGTSTLIPGYDTGEGSVGDVKFIHTSFIGIVTDNISEAFAYLQFDEDDNSNDIGIFDLQFVTTPVPVPAAVWLFGSGLLFLFGTRRRQRT